MSATDATGRLGWMSRSIRAKIAIPFALVIGAIAIFMSLYFPTAMERRERDALLSRGRTIAGVSAFSVRSAVVFEDLPAMEEALQGVFWAEEVVLARVVSASGTVLAEVRGVDRPGPGGSRLETLEASAPVTMDGREIGEVQVLLSQAQLLEEVADTRRAIQALAAAVFLLGLAALVTMSRLVTRPLLGIVDTVERISEGDLTSRAPVTTKDEVSQLAVSFNTMVDRLQSTQSELEIVNRELEARVDERTQRWLDEQHQRMRAEEEKTKIERFYEQILDSLPLEIAVFDLHRRFVYVNPAAVDQEEHRGFLLGSLPEEATELLGITPEVTERRNVAIREAMETGCLVSLEEHVCRPDAPERFFLRVFSPMISRDDEVTKVVAYGVDITERRATEEALHVSEERLRQSQKMEAVGGLAGGIAHDFNNLLTVIIGHAEMLIDESTPGSREVDELEQMKSAAERAATLTRQLLAFSRKQVLEPRLLDINSVVTDVERMLRRLIGEHIEVVTLLNAHRGLLRADPGQLEQVLLNLSVNARDAMPHGGTLTLETRVVDHLEAAARWNDTPEPGAYSVLMVRDTGIGMTATVRQRLFEPFYTTKEVGKGTGLGLATVYGIVSQSGGYIFLDSEVGRGTEFRVYLPQEFTAQGAARSPTEDDVATRTGGREHILLVEDEALVRNFVRKMLENAGYRVTVASGGPEALTLLRSTPDPVDLLFTDVVMPGLPGHELAEKATSENPGLRVLFMSGYTDDALIDRRVLKDGVVLLQKPFSTERALQVVRRVLDTP